jgi:hypothetical protein
MLCVEGTSDAIVDIVKEGTRVVGAEGSIKGQSGANPNPELSAICEWHLLGWDSPVHFITLLQDKD